MLQSHCLYILVPVRFNPATYSVTEGVDASVLITLETLVEHTNSLSVTVVTRDGSVLGKCQYIISLKTLYIL